MLTRCANGVSSVTACAAIVTLAGVLAACASAPPMPVVSSASNAPASPPPRSTAPHAVVSVTTNCAGHAFGCDELLEFYAQNERAAPGELIALDQACQRRDSESCAAFARLLAGGRGVRNEPARAEHMLDSACETGDPFACLRLGELYDPDVDGTLGERTERVLVLYRRACDTGLMRGCSRAANLLWEGANPPPVDARGLAEQSCANGDGLGCQLLGARAENGSDGPRDLPAAVALYRRGCEAGDGISCERFGRRVQDLPSLGDASEADTMLHRGCERHALFACQALVDEINRRHDDAALLVLHRSMCDNDIADACTDAGVMYEYGEGTARDPSTARVMFQRGCERGSDTGCLYLGTTYQDAEGFVHDGRHAAALYEPLCEAGQTTRACAYLGLLYAQGEDVPMDATRAIGLYRRACDGGDAMGCGYLGIAMVDGQGLPQDRAGGERRLDDACIRGADAACLVLGNVLAHERGPGVALRRADAYRRGCEYGLADACDAWGETLAQGRGVRRDRVRAAAVWDPACRAGNSGACLHLAGALARGDGITRDVGRAATLRQAACASTYRSGCHSLPFHPVVLRATVRSARGTEGLDDGTACALRVWARYEGGWCRVRLSCGSRNVYSAGPNGSTIRCDVGPPFRARDTDPSAIDGDPRFELDAALGTMHVSDESQAGRSMDVMLSITR